MEKCNKPKDCIRCQEQYCEVFDQDFEELEELGNGMIYKPTGEHIWYLPSGFAGKSIVVTEDITGQLGVCYE